MASNRVSAHGTGKFLGGGPHAFYDWHRRDVLGHLGVDVEDAQHLFERLLVRRVRGVALLPEELRGAQEHTRAQLPADDVCPLVDEHRQIAPALDPTGEEVPDDRLRGRADDIGLFQFLAAGHCHHRQLRRETLHMLSFLAHEALRDEKREVSVLVASGLETVVQLALQALPDGVAVRLDDHAGFDELSGLGHVALKNYVLVPLGKIAAPGCDG